jgi:hypothetical protein
MNWQRERVSQLNRGWNRRQRWLIPSLIYTVHSWIVCSMSRGKAITLSLTCASLVIAGVVAAVRLWNVHQQTSDWVLSPKEVPSNAQFADREYNCGPDAKPSEHDMTGLTSQGRTAGGAEIFAQPPSSSARVFIIVRTDQGAFGCDLMGGP